MLKIGERIKNLRKKQDVTQEKLAAYLNISYQAVSKWENGTALPDITLIPGIANFFGISADELLGMKNTEETEELENFEKIYHENNRLGKMLDNIALSRKVLEKYPRNFQWMLNLAYPLVQYQVTEEQINYSKEHDFCGEAIRICERILEDCTIDSIRHSAIQILCYEYPKIGKKDLALKLAWEMPDMFICREQLLSHIYDGEEQIKQLQKMLLASLDECAGIIWMLVSNDIMGKELTNQQKIECIEIAINLFSCVFKDDEDINAHNHTLVMQYLKLAQLFCKQNEVDKGMETLLRAERSAKGYDAWVNAGERTNYRSILINRCFCDPKKMGKNWEGTETDLLRLNLDNKFFDILRDREDFKKLQQRLQ